MIWLESVTDLRLSLGGDDLECIRVSERTARLADVYRLRCDGQLPPVLIRDGVVIDGHHRVLAAQMAGRTHVYATESIVRAFGPAVVPS